MPNSNGGLSGPALPRFGSDIMGIFVQHSVLLEAEFKCPEYESTALSEFTYYPDKKLRLIQAPFSGGQGKTGVDRGPEALIQHGIVDQIKSLGWEVESKEPLEFVVPESDESIGNLKRPRYVSQASKTIADEVSETIGQNQFPLTIGGDHSIAIGTVAGVQRKYPDACLLWIDAHADINTPECTPSGNIHGCPVAFLMGLADPVPEPFEWVPKCITPDRIAYIGLRDVDAGEKKLLRDLNIAAFTMYHIDKYGIAKVVEMALQRINPNGDRPIHLSYDVDAIDPMFTPSTGTPVRGGLTLREGLYIAEAVAETKQLVALDLVECNPWLGHQEHVVDTIATSCSIVRSSLGETIL